MSSVSQLFVPLQSMYIAFTIDPEATFKHYFYPIDETTERHFRKFPQKTYVGYCSYVSLNSAQELVQGLTEREQSSGIPARNVMYNEISICPLQHGLTPPDAALRITEDMCAPVAPESQHPKGRKPIKTNKPLPWSNCYHPTCMDVNVLLSTARVDYTHAFTIDSLDFGWMACYASEDGIARQDEDDRDYIDTNDDDSRSYVSSEQSEDSPGEDECVATDEDDPENVVPVVAFTPNLDSIGELNSALELEKDIIFLQRYVR
jgi:hypothetical protein